MIEGHRDMILNDEVTRGIDRIRQDREHGASSLSQQAIKVLGLSLEKTKAVDVDELREEIRTVGEKLARSRPNMAAVANIVSRLVCQILKEPEQSNDLDALKAFARSTCNKLIKHAEKAASEAAANAAEMIGDRDRLMTCSYSSTVCEALKAARQQGKQFHVVVAESRSSQGTAYGKIAAARIRSCGIAVESIPDDAIPYHMSRVNKVMVGADSILKDDTLINGTPTYRAALAAKNAGVPFYCVCETSKFATPCHGEEKLELEEGFDRIPPGLIAGIITEDGITDPNRT